MAHKRKPLAMRSDDNLAHPKAAYRYRREQPDQPQLAGAAFVLRGRSDPAVDVLETFDVIFAGITSDLGFDHAQDVRAGIFEAMDGA